MHITVSPRQVYDEILACIQVGLVPNIISSPGLGKSSLGARVAKDYRLKLIDIRLSQCTPEDLNGFPMREGNKADFKPFAMWPLEGDPLPLDEDGNELEGWFIFFDELTSATKPVQAAAYKVILDKYVGNYKLHPNVVMCAAGNKTTDKAVVNQMSTALQSRMIQYEMEANKDDWIDWAFEAGIDTRIIAYISASPSKLMTFKPDHQDKTFACPRTWEFLSRLIKGKDITDHHLARISGAIGASTGIEFLTFAREFDNLPKLADILKDPQGTMVPPEVSTKYATMAMLSEHVEDDTAAAILQYADRFDIEMKLLLMRAATARDPDLAVDCTPFRKEMRAMSKYMTRH